MMKALKTIRTCPSTLSLPPEFSRKSTLRVSFRRVTTVSSKPKSERDMDEAQNPNEKTGDVMSRSFGDGYATRSEDEGFGGIYGGNQSIPRGDDSDEDKNVIHENHQDYDKLQGSEVKEKEKARHQTDADG